MSVYLIYFYSSLLKGYQQDFKSTLLEQDGHLVIHQKGFMDQQDFSPSYLNFSVSETLQQLLKQIPTLIGHKQEIRTGGLINREDQSYPVSITGSELNSPYYSQLKAAMTQGSFITKSDALILGEDLAETLKVVLGDTLLLMAQDQYDSLRIIKRRVTGLFKANNRTLDNAVVITDLSSTQSLLKLGPHITSYRLFFSDPDQSEHHLQALSPHLNKLELEGVSWLTTHSIIQSFQKIIHISFLIMTIIILVVCSVGIINTILMTLMERLKELGTLRAIGFGTKEMISLIMTELTLLSALGSISGAGLAGYTTYRLSQTGIDMGKSAELMDGANRIMYPSFSPSDMLLYGLFGILAAWIASLYPLRYVLKVTVIESLRNQ